MSLKMSIRIKTLENLLETYRRSNLSLKQELDATTGRLDQAIEFIDHLWDQQAMPDDSLDARLYVFLGREDPRVKAGL